MGMGKKQEFRFLQLFRRKVRDAVESVRGYTAVQNKRMPVLLYKMRYGRNPRSRLL